MKKNFIWIVEINFGEPDKWMPTVGAGLSRDDARKELARWKKNNPPNKHRLRRYISPHSRSEK